MEQTKPVAGEMMDIDGVSSRPIRSIGAPEQSNTSVPEEKAKEQVKSIRLTSRHLCQFRYKVNLQAEYAQTWRVEVKVRGRKPQHRDSGRADIT